MIHKFTWEARGHRSIIDYMIANEKLGSMVTDTTVLRGSDIGSDHYLVISVVHILSKWKKVTLSSNVKETARINNIEEKEWIKHFKTLWTTGEEPKSEHKDNDHMEYNGDRLTLEELEEVLQTTKKPQVWKGLMQS